MPKWAIHDKWALRMGISKETSNYVNRAIDNINMPEDFMEYIKKRIIPRSRGNKISVTDIVSLLDKNLHDIGKGNKEEVRFIKRPILLFLSEKKEEYIRAWYLHFILDYLNSSYLKDWIKNTGASIKECINKYQKNKAVTISETERQLTEVMDFLKGNARELQRDLSLPV